MDLTMYKGKVLESANKPRPKTKWIDFFVGLTVGIFIGFIIGIYTGVSVRPVRTFRIMPSHQYTVAEAQQYKNLKSIEQMCTKNILDLIECRQTNNTLTRQNESYQDTLQAIYD